MEIRERRAVSQPQIEAYGDGGFRLQGAVFKGSLLLLPTVMNPWLPDDFDSVTVEAIEPICAAANEIDLVLVGTGATMRPLPAAVRARFMACGMAVEPMSTGAACRTYNVLVVEGRRVAAALIAVA